MSRGVAVIGAPAVARRNPIPWDDARPRIGVGTTVVAGLLFLLLAIGLWWGVWSTHPSSTTTCGCGDAARFLWFFSWPAFAMGHGHSVLWSPWLFHPTGINLLDDTSVLALGILLSPLTLAAGPVVSMNVALTLAPALSALAMFVLLRRWVAWPPAAFLAGAVFGFSPFMISELALNQLNIAFLAVPPLVVLALDELLVRQRRSPYPVGAALAGLVVLQFFVSTEVLLITAIAVLVGAALLLGWAAWRDPGAIAARSGHALRGLAVAGGLAGVLLAYPVWFVARGPAHLGGPVWSNGAVGRFGTTPASFVSTAGLADLRPGMLRFGGYQGPVLVGLGYLGLGVLVVSVVGTLVWRSDRRLLFFGSVGLVAAVLSLGPGHGAWVPWQVVDRLPWVGDIVEARFTLVVALCVAVMAGVVADRVRRERGPAAGWAVVAVAVVPTVAALWPNLPLTTRPVVLPPWFATVGRTLPPGRVVLTYPAPFSGLQSSQAWQAVDAMRWAQAGGGGPEGQPRHAGAARAGFEVLFGASLALAPLPAPTAANLAAVRTALAVWGVTTVVVPDQAALPVYERGRSAAYAVALMTASIGVRPAFEHSAWVWSSVSPTPAPVAVSAAAFRACTIGAVAADPRPEAVPDCVLGSAR